MGLRIEFLDLSIANELLAAKGKDQNFDFFFSLN